MTLGKRYIPHSDMCGCERCAKQAELETPRQIFDVIDDPEYEEDYDLFDVLLDEEDYLP